MSSCSQFFDALGLTAYAKERRGLDDSVEKFRRFFPFAAPKPAQPTPPPPPPPPPPPRWRFAVIPDEAITRRTKGSARIALCGELDGFSAWVREYRIKAHAEHGHVLTLKEGTTLLAEKREKKGKGWRTVATKKLDRNAMIAMFREVNVSWDDLEEENEPDDDPDWMTDGRRYVKEHTPAPLETENREIASELLMGSDEESWKESQEGS